MVCRCERVVLLQTVRALLHHANGSLLRPRLRTGTNPDRIYIDYLHTNTIFILRWVSPWKRANISLISWCGAASKSPFSAHRRPPITRRQNANVRFKARVFLRRLHLEKARDRRRARARSPPDGAQAISLGASCRTIFFLNLHRIVGEATRSGKQAGHCRVTQCGHSGDIASEKTHSNVLAEVCEFFFHQGRGEGLARWRRVRVAKERVLVVGVQKLRDLGALAVAR